MASTVQEKFDAAVEVVQGLPKNGSFQPSHSLMLRFYSFYKQATCGPCTICKPAFWDVVGKAKWDAWHALGNLSREEAMAKYIEELKNIIEAMPHTEMVADFVEKMGDFYELVDVSNGSNRTDGNPMKIGAMLRKSREKIEVSSKVFGDEKTSHDLTRESFTWSNINSRTTSFQESDSDLEEYMDSLDIPDEIIKEETFQSRCSDRIQEITPADCFSGNISNDAKGLKYRYEVNEQTMRALAQLQEDMNSVLAKLNTIESLSKAQMSVCSRNPSGNERDQHIQSNSWWSLFFNFNAQKFLFILIWPFLVNILIKVINRKRAVRIASRTS